jgi:hypothetical protein
MSTLSRQFAVFSPLFAALLLSTTLHAQTLTWDGATNNSWSNDPADINWTGSPWSAGGNATFLPGTHNISVPDAIGASNILLDNTPVTSPVTVNLSGPGSLAISGGGNLQLGPFRPDNSAGIGATTLNMSALSSFSYDAPGNIFRVGLRSGTQGAHTSGTTVSTVTLADTNTITASQLLMGDQVANSGGGRSVLQLGRVNTINANTIGIANTGRSNALLQFDPNVAGATATFRATDGTSPVATWNIGAVRNFTNNTWAPVVDLSGGSIDALVSTMTIGDANTANQTNRAGTSDATFSMGAGTMDISTLNIGRVTGGGSIGSGFRGAGTFNVDNPAAVFTAGSVNLATMNHTASGGSNISTRGEFNLENGTATITGGIVLGSNTTTGNTGTVDAILRQNAGTLSISGGLLQGSEASGPVNSNVQLLGGTSTIAGGISTDTIRVGFNGRTATATATNGAISIGNGTSTALIGHKTTSGSATSGTLNLQNTSSVTMDLAALDIAYHQGGTSATVLGTLNLSSSGPNSITADLIRLGQIDGGSTGNTTATLNLGANNTINADTFIVGGDKATGIVTTPANSSITIAGKTGPAANLIIGANNGGNTGTNPTASHFNMGSALGTTTNLNATIDNLVIGQYLGTGTGSGKGILTMNGGTLVANNVNLAQTNGSNPLNTTANIVINNGNFTVLGSITDGAGVSSIMASGNTSGTGNFTVGNGMAVDNLRVANNGRTAVATVLAGDVRIGSGTGTNSFVGYRINSGTTTTGTLNLSATDNVLIDTGTFTVAYNEGASGSAAVNGTLLLSQNGTNTIIADLFRIGQIDGAAVGNTIGTVQLGIDNTFQTDLLIVGADKSRGTMTLAPGGTLTVGGKSAAAADLFIGANNSNTSLNPAVSHLDTSGGTFNATIDNLQIGTYGGTTNSGSGKGLLTMDAGTVTANNVLLAQTAGPNLAGTQGTLALNGGTFIAGSIARGDGVATFQFNGGNLSFATFGTSTTPFALNNTGTGTLNPGVDTSAPQVASTLFGTSMVHGAYTQGSSATLAFDLSLDSGADLMIVDGPVTLAGNLGLLTHGTYTGSLQSFTLISNLSGNPVSGTFNGLDEGDTVVLNFGGVDVPYFISYQGGTSGQDVVLSVPEPARALLLLFASAPLLLRRRRDR